MKKMRMLAVSAAISIIVGCNGSGGGTGTGNADSGVTTSASYSAGEDVILSSQSVTEAGSTITLSSSNPALNGIQVTFSAGSTDGSELIQVGSNEGGTFALPQGIPEQEIQTLVIHTDGDSTFDQPVFITIPYTDPDNVPVPYYIGSDGTLRPVLVTEIDEVNMTLTYITTHASTWAWIYDALHDSPDDLDTNFRPIDDGFDIANYGSTINSGGECFGMTAFTQWYYKAKSSSDGDFNPRFLTVVGSDSAGNNLTGQDVVATRAHSAVQQAWTVANYVTPYLSTTDSQRYQRIVQALRTSGNPVVLGLQAQDSVVRHAVLAYGADLDDGQLFIYDPNYPDSQKVITFDSDNGAFDNYGNYVSAFMIGDGTYDLGESFSNIYDDAKLNFTGTNNPEINITSHTNGGTVSTKVITLAGTIQSSEVLVKELDVHVGNNTFTTSVSEAGAFSVGVTLDAGSNLLSFVTKDVDGTPITPNNLDTDQFSLNVNSELDAVMHVTLTWDKDDTDVDLYVIDPSGDYSSYYHKNTADGGELDYDITDGYGPEHWTLLNSDTVQYDLSSYVVRAHYFSDHGNGGTNYTLKVKLYEGTDREVEYVKTGYLSASNSSNSDPTDTGSDWVTFGSGFVLTESNGLSTASAPIAKKEVSLTDLAVDQNAGSSVPAITAEVPNESERMK